MVCGLAAMAAVLTGHDGLAFPLLLGAFVLRSSVSRHGCGRSNDELVREAGRPTSWTAHERSVGEI
jgi:hypothetical protein